VYDETSTGIFLLTCDIALSKLVEKLSNFLSASFIKFTFYNFLHYSHRLKRYIYIQQAYKSIDSDEVSRKLLFNKFVFFLPRNGRCFMMVGMKEMHLTYTYHGTNFSLSC